MQSDKKHTILGVGTTSTHDDGGSADTMPYLRGAPAVQKAALKPGVVTASNPEALIAGTMVEDKYRVVSAIGQGAMGTVLLAHDEVLDRDVAIKVIRPHIRLVSDFQSRFLREARAMASVRHENVVAIHSFGQYLDAPYFVMEYVPGMSLERWIEQHRPIDVDVALGILGQICKGVQAIHDAGAVHLDLKPGNVLIGPAFRIAVTDLGLARRTAQGSRTDTPAPGGTPTHMAPELIFRNERKEPDWPRADIYSLGVLAYELLSGRLPFESDSMSSILMQQITATPVRPSEVRAELSPNFDGPIMAALSKDPQSRPRSATAFYQSLATVRGSTRPPASIVRILVADDDGTFRALARSILSSSIPGAEVTCVADGDQALAAIDRQPPAVVLLDLQMPGMNGLEVMAAMHSIPRSSRPRVVVATAVGTVHDWKILSELEADAFLVKPVTPPQLVRAISRVLGLAEQAASVRAPAPG